MSNQGLGIFHKFLKKNFNYVAVRNVSRRSSNVDGPFKTVKSRKSTKDETNLAWRDPNFELLASPRGFPFFLPGNVGLAWYDTQTTVQTHHEFIMEQIKDEAGLDRNIICSVQECPTVLRKTVCDLFPYRTLEGCDLSIVTLSLKPDSKLMRTNKEIETERLAQTFVITAKSVCDKLRKAGYWADFINPFSGRPYLFPNSIMELYKADEKFRCLDFQIFEIDTCKIISNDENSSKKRFIGSLFTNAPSKKNSLNTIFTQM